MVPTETHDEASPSRGLLLPSYFEIESHLDSGDVLFFGGESRLCRTIKRLTGGKWSHMALVARASAEEPPLLWEATLAPELPDLETQSIAPGVNLFPLMEWILHYAGETAIRRLRVERTPEMRANLLDFYCEAKQRPYEKNRLELLRSAYDGLAGQNRQAGLESYFCSELVAEAYQRMGLLPLDPPSNEYTPRDFSTDRKSPLPLLLGATLDPEILVCQ